VVDEERELDHFALEAGEDRGQGGDALQVRHLPGGGYRRLEEAVRPLIPPFLSSTSAQLPAIVNVRRVQEVDVSGPSLKSVEYDPRRELSHPDIEKTSGARRIVFSLVPGTAGDRWKG
jgi:hypothetical protein